MLYVVVYCVVLSPGLDGRYVVKEHRPSVTMLTVRRVIVCLLYEQVFTYLLTHLLHGAESFLRS